MSTSRGNTPRSSSRSKRSTTNLADLRLAPLTTRYGDDILDDGGADGHSHTFDFSSTYRSAPTTPRVLSRSSSRRYLGGLSRRSSLYETDQATPTDDERNVSTTTRVPPSHLHINTSSIPKAISEAALGIPPHQKRQRLSGQGVQLRRETYNPYSLPQSRHTSGTTTPRIRAEADDWLARTGQAASSIVREQKGHTHIASRHSTAALYDLPSSDDDDEDEGYEELAAISARSRRFGGSAADDELSPVSTRTSRWGSRYGSRRTSRGSSAANLGMTGTTSGSHTPLASAQAHAEGGRGGYFEPMNIEPDIDDSSDDEAGTLGAVTTSLGGLVDKIIGFPLFNVEEERDTTGTESEGTDVEAERKRDAEVRRRRAEKERLRIAQERRRRSGGGGEGRDEGVGGGWQDDARWLLGRAREAWS